MRNLSVFSNKKRKINVEHEIGSLELTFIRISSIFKLINV